MAEDHMSKAADNEQIGFPYILNETSLISNLIVDVRVNIKIHFEQSTYKSSDQ